MKGLHRRKRFRWRMQHDSMQCGAACLRMVCEYYGMRIPLAELAEMCGSTAEGVSMLGISRAAEELGFDTTCVKIPLESLVDSFVSASAPCILHWNQNHFVVLYAVGSDGKRFRIADPGKGKIACSRAELLEHWAFDRDSGTGVALMLRPSERFDGIARKKNARKEQGGYSLSIIWEYLQKFWKQSLAIALCLLFASAMQLVLPFMTQAIVDRGINDRDIAFIWLVLLGEMMIVFGRTATDFIQRRLLLRIGDHGRVQSFLTGQVLGIIFTDAKFACKSNKDAELKKRCKTAVCKSGAYACVTREIVIKRHRVTDVHR